MCAAFKLSREPYRRFVFVGDSSALQGLRAVASLVINCGVRNGLLTEGDARQWRSRLAEGFQRRLSEMPPIRCIAITQLVELFFLKAAFVADVGRALTALQHTNHETMCENPFVDDGTSNGRMDVFLSVGNWDICRPNRAKSGVAFDAPFHSRMMSEETARNVSGTLRRWAEVAQASFIQRRSLIATLRVMLPPLPNCTAPKFLALNNSVEGDPYTFVRGGGLCDGHLRHGTATAVRNALRTRLGWPVPGGVRDAQELVDDGACVALDGTHLFTGDVNESSFVPPTPARRCRLRLASLFLDPL